jgi:hypothetical protein
VPRQNRVDPFGNLIADRARGTLFGNRGVLHADDGSIVRRHALRRWIYCRLEFKGRKRELLQPGRYTELFFLDEATALAPGIVPARNACAAASTSSAPRGVRIRPPRPSSTRRSTPSASPRTALRRHGGRVSAGLLRRVAVVDRQ